MIARTATESRTYVLRFSRELPGDRADPIGWRARISEVNTGRKFHAVGIDAAFHVVRSLLSAASEKGAED